MREMSHPSNDRDRRNWQQEIEVWRDEVKRAPRKQVKRLPLMEIGLGAHIAELKRHAFRMGVHT
jgi:hypothetical protein